MLRIKSFTPAAVTALLCACQPVRKPPPAMPLVAPSSPAWGGIAVLDNAAQAPREGTLEVMLVVIEGNDVKPVARAEFAVKPSARIDFALPSNNAGDAALAHVGWRVWLRDASGRLRYASDRIVAADRGATATIALRALPSR